VRTLLRVEEEGPMPTAVERQALARFGGFGAVALSLFPDPVSGQYKSPAWESLGQELSTLLSPEEYDSAKRTTFTRLLHLADRRQSEALSRLGVPQNATIVEPGCDGALHGLREFLLFANKGTLRRKQEEELMNHASCLNLVTNAVVTWNTVYMAAVIDRPRAEGKTVKDEEIARLSPARYEHINPYGKYRLEIEEGLSRSRLRPLRQPTEQKHR
jgi:hypothetical protein